ncbi:stage II sporulation protein R [Ruminiclostridium herbifermentans]|uniref:Stage II sporulation protein R n=1 Tax=Ruminiclostridium herbifermentans TaxID=2488810 RepID=A0A4U7JI66_9FIRM|nr:stage II sporulation protein R [Ruminiclostridium herbifermentans]QNU66600.1 stage II sporulation protein R [Ruminiclostridium herbifermentans]
MSKVVLFLKSNQLSKKIENIVKLAVIVLILSVLAAWIVSNIYAEDVNAGLSQNLIRLHVIANSDSDADQALKLQVRDAIIEYMKGKLANSKDIDETKTIINNNLRNIEKISQEVIAKNNFSYSVNAAMGNYDFPTKVYGDISLPAGRYEALRVVIGEGAGANWWCVLFPPLCFIDATHGTIPDSVKNDLKSSLSPEEFRLITTAENDDDIPIKIRFKVVELLQGSKIKVTGAINRMFR